jgi:DNA-binding GntR family transcriptional regulator
MSISRTPLREALFRLERDGLIKKMGNGGFAVIEDSYKDVEDLFELRLLLERHAMKLAVKNIIKILKKRDERLADKAISEHIKYLKRIILKNIKKNNESGDK